MSYGLHEWHGTARLHRIRRVRTLALILVLAVGAGLAVVQVLIGVVTRQPPYPSMEPIVPTAVFMSFVAMILAIHFRRLEIRHAPADEDRYPAIRMSTRRSLLVMIVTGSLAAVLLAPGLHSGVVAGMIQTYDLRILARGSHTLEGGLPSVDSLGFSRTTALTVDTIAGAVQARIERDGQLVQQKYLAAGDNPWTAHLDTTNRIVYDLVIQNPLSGNAEVRVVVARDLFPDLFSVVPFALGMFVVTGIGWLWMLRPLTKRCRDAWLRAGGENRFLGESEPPAEEPESPIPYQTRFLDLPPPRPTGLPPPGESASGPAILVRAAPTDRIPPPPTRGPPPPTSGPSLAEASELEAQGNLDGALATYDALLRRSPRDREAALGKGRVLVGLGRRPAALGVYRSLLRDNGADIDALRGCLQIHEGDGAWRDALDAADRILALTPDDADAHARRGDVLAALRMPKEAGEAYEKALARRPGDPELEARARSVAIDIPGLISRALVSSASGDFQAAVEAFDEVLRVEPDNMNVLVGKSAALRGLGHLEEARGLVEEALAQNPSHTGALLTMAQMLAEAGDLPGSLEALESLLAIHPQEAEALLEQGEVLAALGRPEEARASYEAVLKLRPGDREAAGKLRTLLEGEKPEPTVLVELFRIRGLGPTKASALIAAGFRTLEDLRRATIEGLMAVEGISRELAEEILHRFAG